MAIYKINGLTIAQQAFYSPSSPSFEPFVEILCLAAIDLGTGVEQPFGSFLSTALFSSGNIGRTLAHH